MLFAITLAYRRPKVELETQLESHRQWLVEHTRAGTIVFAGPLEPQIGGLILAQGETRSVVEELMASDPFVHHGLVDVSLQASDPALRHADFPARWAPSAKAIPTP